MTVTTTVVDDAFTHHRATVPGLFLRPEQPPFFPRLQIHSVQMTVVAAEIHEPAADNRRGTDTTAGGKGPFLLPGLALDRIKATVATADKNQTFRNGRIFGHTLCFTVCLAVLGACVYKRWKKLWFLILSFGSAS